jgi:hypothetical protein
MTFLTDYNGLVRDCFVETGTGGGDSLFQAQRNAFAILHSVEWSHHLYLGAVQRFGRDPRVHLWHGDSAVILPAILDPQRPTTFWLDAHWAGGGFTEEHPPHDCPLLGELAAIFAVPWVVPPIVLVDDATVLDGTFLQTPRARELNFRPGDWPSVAEVRAAVPPQYQMIRNDAVIRFEWF